MCVYFHYDAVDQEGIILLVEEVYAIYYATAHCTTVLRRGGSEGIGPPVSMETTGCVEGRSTEGKASGNQILFSCASHPELDEPSTANGSL